MQEFLLVSAIASWFMIILNLLISLALVRRVHDLPSGQQGSSFELIAAGEDAPTFSAKTLSGTIVSKDNYTNQSLALVFISPGCEPCKSHIPELEIAYPKAKRSGVELLVLSLGDVDETKQFIKDVNTSLPILIAPPSENPLIKNYKIQGTPSYYMIDTEHKVVSGGLMDQTWNAITQSWN